ncbi:hypothetical protein ACVIYL_008916 [Bradyrhizobium sp. USDA 3315]
MRRNDRSLLVIRSIRRIAIYRPGSIGVPLRSPNTRCGRYPFCRLNLLLSLIQSLRDIEAGRSFIGSCQRSGGAQAERGARLSRSAGYQRAGGAIVQRGAPIAPTVLVCPFAASFFKLAGHQETARYDSKGKPISPNALGAVGRLNALVEIERAIEGRAADERSTGCQGRHKLLLEDMLLRTQNPLALLRGIRANQLHADALG